MFKAAYRIFLVLCVAATASNCVVLALGAAGGAAGYGYKKGNLNDTLAADVRQVHAASVMAVEGMGLPILESHANDNNARVKSEYPDGGTVWIRIKTIGEGKSEITIRVGTAGNSQRSVRIMDAVKANI